MKLWITGSQGMVGKTLSHLCQERQLPTLCTTHQTLDISQLDQVQKFARLAAAQGVTHILNCAAFTDVDRAEKEADLAFLVNARGPENLGLAAKELGLKVIHLSTDYVFDGLASSPYSEEGETSPLNVYGKTKLEGEKMLLKVAPESCIIRTSWVFGKGGKNFISSLLQHMKTKFQMEVVADQKGRPTYVNDLASAILSLLPQKGVFHFANEKASSRFEIAERILHFLQTNQIPVACQLLLPVPSTTFPTPAKRPKYSVLKTDKITAVLGKPPRPWEACLKEFFHEI